MPSLRTLWIGLVSIASISGSAEIYPRPEGYKVPALRLRADSGVALNLPSRSYFALQDALFLDTQDILASFSVWQGEAHSGVLRWSQQHGLSTHHLAPQNFASHLSPSPTSAEIFFEEVNFGGYSEGVMALSIDFMRVRRSVFDPTFRFMSSPQALRSPTRVLVREQKNDASQGLSVLSENASPETLLESSSRNFSSPYAYLFPPVAHAAGLAVIKVRHGKPGQLSESQGDELLQVDLKGATPVVRSLLKDRDLDGSSTILGFDNTGALNARGDIAWIVGLANGRRALARKRLNQAVQILVEEHASVITAFSHFHIAMNQRGDIVFRAQDSQGLEGVWRVDSSGTLFPVLREHDRVKTDQGPARIGVSGNFGGVIFMSPQVNEYGDILVGAYLRTDEIQARNIGMGYFVIETDEDPLRAGGRSIQYGQVLSGSYKSDF